MRHIEEAEQEQDEDRGVGLNKVMAFQLAVLLEFTGINVVVIYAAEMLQGINSEELELLTPTVLNVFKTGGAMLAIYFLKHVGRKFVLQFGLLVTVVGHSLTGIGYILQKDPLTNSALSDAMIVGGSLVYMTMYGFALGTIIWLYIPEVVSPRVLPATTTAVWGVGCLIVVLFPVVNDHLLQTNPALIFFFFALLCLLSFAFNQKFMVESMNKTEK